MSTQITALGPSRRPRRVSTRKRVWIAVWMLASVVPIMPYGLPLLNHALADTPYAYLIWIPALAFPWAAIVLWRMPKYQDDGELNGILGLSAAGMAGSLLFAGLHQWSQFFVASSAGLLIWPFWALGMAWLIFGVGVTSRLLKPLGYLVLAWPPLYTKIVTITNPVLYGIANHGVTMSSRWLTWLKSSPTYGEYFVQNHGNSLLVTVSSACSGGDSFLAMIILLPVVLGAFRGGWWKKLILIAVGAVLAIVLNLTRLGVLLASAHWFSPTFTFGVLHELLGMVLFVVIMAVLALIGKSLGMNSRRSSVDSEPSGAFLSTPGWGRAVISVSLTVLLTVALFPLYTWASGSLRAPITVSTSKLSDLMPKIPGYSRTLLGIYDEASVLGPGSYGTAYAYSSSNGQYAMAELWWSYNLNALLAYGVNNCLLFHGNTIVGGHSFQITSGIDANSFAILLPPDHVGGKRSLYEDVSYLYAVKYDGRNAYIRAEFATPVQYGVAQNSPIVHQIVAALPGLWRASNPQSSAVAVEVPSSQKKSLKAFHNFVRDFSSRILTPSIGTNTAS